MLSSKIFCNVPWFEVHINADGTYHTCGAQVNSITLSESAKKYNVFEMTIPEWINSEYQRNARLKKLNGVAESLCKMCYQEDEAGSSSKRVRENHKSNIISNDSFLESYKNSKDKKWFDYSAAYKGFTDFLKPVSYHISLGNECNLTCRMCGPLSSSKIAAQQYKEGTWKGPIKQNWTNNEKTWNSITEYICNTENLKFVHLIGGEPLLNPKFEDIIDKLINAKKTEIYLGFTTNGTVFSENFLKKLNVFKHVDIGISIETVGTLNDKIRAGAKTNEVLKNIDRYLKYKSSSHIYVTVRTVPSALSVHTLDELYLWCIDRQVDVMSNILNTPQYLQIRNLPKDIKDRLIKKYKQWKFSEPIKGWEKANPREPERFKEHIDNEIRTIINCLKQENNQEQTKILYEKLESWGWFRDEKIKNYFFIKK